MPTAVPSTPPAPRGSPERIYAMMGQLVHEIEFGVASGQIPESTDFSFILSVPSVVGSGWVTAGKVMTSPFPRSIVDKALARASENFARPFEDVNHE